jgi:SAM-dependent methyltransferase
MIPDRARLAYICRRFFFDFAPPGVRAGLISRFGKSWHHFCPVCEEPVGGYAPLANLYFEQLAAHGSDLRIPDFETCNFENYQCAHCGSTDRDRLYALYLAQRLPASAEAQAQFSLLDIAPGAALSAHIRRKYRLRYRTADLFQKNVDDRVDVTSMTCYSDGMFDAFICSHVLEHVSDDSKAMRELRRILKPGGWGIAMVPINTKLREVREDPTEKDEGQRWKRFGQGDHLRVYSPEGFVSRLESAGFRVLKLGKQEFGTEKMERCGLSPGSVLYIVEKN